jgi:hypothetical protein
MTTNNAAIVEAENSQLVYAPAREAVSIPAFGWESDIGPPESPSSQYETLVIRGTCLRPYLLDGDLIIVARGMPARDRDIVVANYRFRGRGPQSVRMPDGSWQISRPVKERMATKQLRYDDEGRAWLVSADNALPLSLSTSGIHGVVVAWNRIHRSDEASLPPVREMNFLPPAH